MATINSINLTGSKSKQQKAGTVQPKTNKLVTVIHRVPPGWWKYFLIMADAIGLLAAFVAAYYVRYELQLGRTVDPANQVGMSAYVPFMLLLVCVSLLSFFFSGVYPYQPGRNLVEESYTIATATMASVVILSGVNLIYEPLSYSRLLFLYTAFLVTLLLGLSRVLILQSRLYLRHFGIGVTRVLLVGVGDVGRMFMRTVVARPELGYLVVGFLDDNPVKGGTDIGPYKALGPVDNFMEVIEQNAIDNVVICLPWQSHRMIQRLLRVCEQQGVRAQVVPDLFQWTKSQLQVEDLNGIPLISSRPISIQGWNLIVKRAFDLLFCALIALLALPIMLLITLAIRLDSPGPIFYRQTRIGRNGAPFTCFKFRSMVTGADEMRQALRAHNDATGPLFKVRNDPRRTRVGRFLRRFSLDELPQLFNVFRGEMSLIGPRPNLPEEVEQYEEWHKKRLAASPGLTGLWQVSGRSDLTFDEMVLLDIYYVENWSLALDLNILLRSAPAMLHGRGAY